MATVYFHAVDLYGQQLPYEVARFALENSKQDFSKSFIGLKGTRLPYGKYSYTLRRTDHPYSAQLVGTVVVDRAEVWTTVAYGGTLIISDGQTAEPLEGAPKGFVIAGQIHSREPFNAPVWIRLQCAYASRVIESRVDEAGRFQITEYLRGRYIAAVFSSDRVLYTGIITFRPRNAMPSPLVIDLSMATPKEIVVE